LALGRSFTENPLNAWVVLNMGSPFGLFAWEVHRHDV
jgi:hypothetical protein